MTQLTHSHRARRRSLGVGPGARLGANLGFSVAATGTPGQYAVRERCESGHREHYEGLVGDRVKYRYNGRAFRARTHRYPADHIPVRVSVEPAHPH